MRLLGLPAPRHHGYRLFRNWLRIPFPDKLRSTGGTLRRIVTRKYFKPAEQVVVTARESDKP
jgi:coenzyme F420 hydrogenase subunit beta